MTEQAKRGFVPSDRKDFGEEAIPLLRRAAAEVCYLTDRGYPIMSAVRFVGDHYQFTERQRLALTRTVSPGKSLISRRERQISDIAGRTISIDGFNVIIGLEIACSDSMLFKCMDGTIRDLAGLHGTYRLIPETDRAVTALMKALNELKVARAEIYLDKPVSNSGRLRERIYSLAQDISFELEVFIEDQVDTILKGKPLVASGDAIILDECPEWFNLTENVIRTQLGGHRYTDILPE